MSQPCRKVHSVFAGVTPVPILTIVPLGLHWRGSVGVPSDPAKRGIALLLAEHLNHLTANHSKANSKLTSFLFAKGQRLVQRLALQSFAKPKPKGLCTKSLSRFVDFNPKDGGRIPKGLWPPGHRTPFTGYEPKEL